MPPEIPVTEFKARCLELMKRVSEKRESYVVTKRGRAVARVVPVPRRAKETLFGRLKGQAVDVQDITRPVLPPSEWEALERKASTRRRDAK